MLAFCRSLTAVIALGLAVTASAAQERGSRDSDRSNSHEDARQHASEHREQSGVLALLPGDSVTEHSIDLPSGNLAYTATAGTFALFDQSGERSAEIFYTAFVVKSANAAAARPVTFVFNGGPGAASAFLNLGMVGPRIAEFGLNGRDGSKVRLIDNPDTWLPFTDLVLIDPVGTGWSRAAKPDDNRGFWSVHSDAQSIAKVIALYVAKNGRANSPKSAGVWVTDLLPAAIGTMSLSFSGWMGSIVWYAILAALSGVISLLITAFIKPAAKPAVVAASPLPGEIPPSS